MVKLTELSKVKKPEKGEIISSLDWIISREKRNRAFQIFSSGRYYLWNGLVTVGRAAWIFSTSMLIILIPLKRAIQIEEQMFEQERQMREHQESGQFVLPGLTSNFNAPTSLPGGPMS